MATIEFDYDCCGEHIEMPAVMPEGSLMLANASLVDTLTLFADAAHDQKHPECAPVDETAQPAS